MSLKRFAMLSAISYHNQQNYTDDNNNNNNNNNTNYGSNKTETVVFIPTPGPESTTKDTKSNKSTLIQLKQQQQHTEQLVSPILLENTTPITTLETSFSSTDLLTQILNADKATTKHNTHHRFGIEKGDDPLNDINGDDSSNDSNENNEASETVQLTRPERPPVNTYTSTTYYGSGFGVFHQQNIRSNGGGLVLTSGTGASSGHSTGSYSNGINNNVNLLLGGAMLTLITTILCVVCYCCHRNIKKRTEAALRQQRQWLEGDPNMEIYSVEQCYETSGLFVGDSMDGLATIPALHHEPPPSYDAVVAMQEQQQLLLQQHQQQLLIQQQELPTTNSPPPGYRSSLDISSIMTQGRGATSLGSGMTIGGSVRSGIEINSLASTSANLRSTNSISPENSMLNYNDINGNVSTVGESVVATATPTNINRNGMCYLRHKRNIAANQISQLNMKKVLQAQSCCSLQRAEVENMWNAAAAALAARSAHLPSDSGASNSASVSSPTLAMSARKPPQIYRSSNSNAPETFGSRYLKQNYYRRGCPLCGKFRYDDSNISISIESNLDSLTDALTEETSADGPEDDSALKIPEVHEDDEIDNNNTEIADQCSCGHAKQSDQEDDTTASNSLQNLNSQQNVQKKERERIPQTEFVVTDDNANAAARQSNNQTASNNNNEVATNDLPSTSTAADTQLPRPTAAADARSISTASTPSTTINLDCINENGIISLDMSKIIDKTGLPTYDAALKLESSGYV